MSKVDPLEQVIAMAVKDLERQAELERERDDAQSAIDAIVQRRAKLAAIVNSSNSNDTFPFDSNAPRSLAQGIEEFLKRNPAKPTKAEQVVHSFRNEDQQTIRSTLSRLSKTPGSHVKRISRGLYGYFP